MHPLNVAVYCGKPVTAAVQRGVWMPQNRLKEIRELRGLSRAEVADKLNTTEVSVGRYEREDQRLDMPLLGKFARILKCTIGQIVGEVPIDQDGAAAPLDHARMVAVIDALDHYLAENKLRVHAGGRGDLVMAIYDWSIEQQMPVAEIHDLTRIGPLLRPALAK